MIAATVLVNTGSSPVVLGAGVAKLLSVCLNSLSEFSLFWCRFPWAKGFLCNLFDRGQVQGYPLIRSVSYGQSAVLLVIGGVFCSEFFEGSFLAFHQVPGVVVSWI